MSSIKLNAVEKWFGATQVIKGVDLEIEDGEFVIFVGPSGCGKSTLLRMIAGLEETSRGQIMIADRDATAEPPSKRGLAMVFQSYALYPHMSVRDNVGFPLKSAGLPKAEVDAKVKEAAHVLKLNDYLDRRPKDLSGGQRQRVSIARALACDPRLLVLDEPTSALDVLVQARVLRLLNDLRVVRGLTYIFITHDLAVVRNVADRVAVFQSGQLVELGETTQIFSAPQAAYTRQLIGAVPVVDAAELNLRNKLAEGV